MIRTLKIRSLAAGALLAALFLVPAAGRADDTLPDISKTPAYELLGALDLLKVSPREGLAVGEKAARPDGSSVVRITLGTKPVAAPFSARGLGILQVEMANINIVSLQSFDLLYNGGGRLIAVFPVFPGEVLDKEPQTPEKWEKIQPKYFDLSPYYMEVPRSGSPGELEKWRAFASGHKKDGELIASFVEERFKPLTAAYPAFRVRRLPYRLHEIDIATGEWAAYEFSPLVFSQAPDTGTILSDIEPGEFIRLFGQSKPDKRRTVIPTFPSVYALVTLSPDETTYLRYVSTKFDLGPESKLLVVGPGTGVDTWIASFRSSEPVRVVGINPLEVANTVATAKIAGFKVNAIVGDNVADEKGNLRFPGEKFDAVFWSMPAVWPEGFPEGHAPSLSDYWDGDVGSFVLARLAKALPSMLKPDGRALLWNSAPYADGKNMVAETLKFAGTKEKVFDVEDERFLKRKLPKEEWFKCHLYILSRAR